jgi:membrane-bound metal-dependent hydrolase YbcI (DUF457 family)
MGLMKDKRGLNSQGHKVFSITIYIIFYAILQSYVNLDVKIFIFGFVPFLIGSLILDWVENSKMGPRHRAFWHSFRFMTIITFIIIPLLLAQYFITKSNNFIGLVFFFFGILSHALPDSLTKSSIDWK